MNWERKVLFRVLGPACVLSAIATTLQLRAQVEIPRFRVTLEASEVQGGDTILGTVGVRGDLPDVPELQVDLASSSQIARVVDSITLSAPDFSASFSVTTSNRILDEWVTITATTSTVFVQAGSARLLVLSHPLFFLEFEGPDSIVGPPGSQVEASYAIVLRSLAHEYEVTGVDTSLAVDNADNVRIIKATFAAPPAHGLLTSGTNIEGSEGTECEGLEACVTRVLFFPSGYLEFPSPRSVSIAYVTVLFTITNEAKTTTLRYVDGCLPDYDNTVTVSDVFGVSPEKGSLDIQIIPAIGKLFQRGDSNSDGAIDISDSVYTLGFLFLGGPTASCSRAADANNDSSVDLSDAVYGLSFLFLGGSPPPDPRGECGFHTTDDGLSCDSYPPCN